VDCGVGLLAGKTRSIERRERESSLSDEDFHLCEKKRLKVGGRVFKLFFQGPVQLQYDSLAWCQALKGEGRMFSWEWNQSGCIDCTGSGRAARQLITLAFGGFSPVVMFSLLDALPWTPLFL